MAKEQQCSTLLKPRLVAIVTVVKLLTQDSPDAKMMQKNWAAGGPPSVQSED